MAPRKPGKAVIDAKVKKLKEPAKAAKGAQRSKSPARPKPAERWGTRSDLGAPIDGFFTRQPPALRAILEALREEVERAAPEAVAAIKWGMPFFTLRGEMMCALAAHKSHVNLILAGPPGTYADLDGRLEGDGKTGKHLKLRALADLPRAAVRAWLKTAAATARAKPAL
jgi:hypothetical protein